MAIKEYAYKRTHIGRLSHGSDLLKELTKFVTKKGIKLGKLQMIGAVKRAVAGFYDSEKEQYVDIVFDKPMEVLSLTGNISLKGGEPFIHAHITLGDEKGQSFGGHLMEGTIVFAAEIIIDEFEGEELEREFDETTKLALWEI